jgi:hypothetical protein
MHLVPSMIEQFIDSSTKFHKIERFRQEFVSSQTTGSFQEGLNVEISATA